MVFRQIILLLFIMIVVVACGNDDDGNSSSGDSSNVVTPEPTRRVVEFQGPILGDPSSQGVSFETCEEGEDCDAQRPTIVADRGALPLTPTTIAGIEIGVPEGFEIEDFGTSLLMIPLTDEEAEGNFNITFRRMNQTDLDNWLLQFSDLDPQAFARQNGDGSLTGETIGYGGRGQIVIWTVGGEEYLVAHGFANLGYWPLYSATFEAMMDSMRLRS